MINANESKQDPEDSHDTEGKGKDKLADERRGHGHSGHSGAVVIMVVASASSQRINDAR